MLVWLKTPWRDGTSHIALQPLELLEKLAALVPPPYTRDDAAPLTANFVRTYCRAMRSAILPFAPVFVALLLTGCPNGESSDDECTNADDCAGTCAMDELAVCADDDGVNVCDCEECIEDDDCSPVCSEDQIPVCEGADDGFRFCDCEPLVPDLDVEEPTAAAVQGQIGSLDASVETAGVDDLIAGLDFESATAAIASVVDAGTGNPLVEAEDSSLFDIGYVLPPGTDVIRVNFDCTGSGDSSGSIALYDGAEVLVDDIAFALRCFPQASEGPGDIFFSLEQPIERRDDQWVNSPEFPDPGLVARAIFPDASLRSVTARFNEQCEGSIGVQQFNSNQAASAYRIEPLFLDIIYNLSSLQYTFPNPPTGSSLFNLEAPYAMLRNQDTGLLDATIEDQPPATPPVPGDPNGIYTSFEVDPRAKFFRFSAQGESELGTFTFDCDMELDGATTVSGLPISDEECRFIDAFYRNLPPGTAVGNSTAYAGTRAATDELLFSGASGVNGDFGLSEPGTWCPDAMGGN